MDFFAKILAEKYLQIQFCRKKIVGNFFARNYSWI